MKRFLILVGLAFFLVNCAWAGTDRLGTVEAEQDDNISEKRLEFHGTIELEYRSEEGFDDGEGGGRTTSNRDATVELSAGYAPTDWMRGFVLLSWEDEGPLDFEEAFLTIGQAERTPFSVTAGRVTLPFGAIDSIMVSDPLTLDLAETQAEAVLAGIRWRQWNASVYAYDGTTTRQAQSRALKSYGADVHFLVEEAAWQLLAGISWMANIEDSNGLTEYIRDERLTLRRRVPGMAAYASLEFGNALVSLNYVTALEDPEFFDEEEWVRWEQPEAWAGELAYRWSVNENLEILGGFTYSTTDGLGDLLAKRRLGGAISIFPTEHLEIAFEYLRETDYPGNEGGTGDDADLLTLLLAMEF